MCQHGLMQAFKLAKIEQENPNTFTLWMEDGLADCQPGQFVMAWLPDVGEKPFSLHSANPLALTISAVGSVSKAITSLQPGASLWIRGPLGNGYSLQGRKHLLVGGGYGAAPLSYLAQEALSRGDEVVVCLGARSAKDLLLVDSLREMGAEVLVATEDGSEGVQGLVTLHVAEQIAQNKPDCLYACGPTGMLKALFDLCKTHGIPAQLSFEALTRCGVGLCGACELDESLCTNLGLPTGWLVCHDGPVAKLTPR